MPKRRRQPYRPPEWGGDHGPGTPAATSDTELVPMEGPNRIARRQRKNHLVGLGLTMRQTQAAEALRDAWCRVEMLSSGSPLKTKVDTSARPDAAVAEQVDANSRWAHMTKTIPAMWRPVVDHVVCLNRPLDKCEHPLRGRENLPGLKIVLDLVANRLRY